MSRRAVRRAWSVGVVAFALAAGGLAAPAAGAAAPSEGHAGSHGGQGHGGKGGGKGHGGHGGRGHGGLTTPGNRRVLLPQSRLPSYTGFDRSRAVWVHPRSGSDYAGRGHGHVPVIPASEGARGSGWGAGWGSGSGWGWGKGWQDGRGRDGWDRDGRGRDGRDRDGRRGDGRRLPGGYAWPDGEGRKPRIIDPIRYVRVPGSNVVFVVYFGPDGRTRSRFVTHGPWYGWDWDDAADFPEGYRVRGIYAPLRPILSGDYNRMLTEAPGGGEEGEPPEMIEFDDLLVIDQAEILLGAGEVDRAVAKYAEHLEANPEDTRAARSYAVALLRAGRWIDGFAMMRLAYSRNPALAQEPLGGHLFSESDGVLRGVLRDAVRQAHRARSAAAWLTVAVLMQAEGKPGRTVGAQIERAERLGLEREVSSALRSAAGLKERAGEGAEGPGEEEEEDGEGDARGLDR